MTPERTRRQSTLVGLAKLCRPLGVEERTERNLSHEDALLASKRRKCREHSAFD